MYAKGDPIAMLSVRLYNSLLSEKYVCLVKDSNIFF